MPLPSTRVDVLQLDDFMLETKWDTGIDCQTNGAAENTGKGRHLHPASGRATSGVPPVSHERAHNRATKCFQSRLMSAPSTQAERQPKKSNEQTRPVTTTPLPRKVTRLVSNHRPLSKLVSSLQKGLRFTATPSRRHNRSLHSWTSLCCGLSGARPASSAGFVLQPWLAKL